MILLAFIGSLEFYVIAFAVAIALVALMARPADKGEAQTLFARGVANEPSGEDGIVMTTDSDGRLEWTRHGDNDIKIIERKADDKLAEICHTDRDIHFSCLQALRPGRYHLYYEASWSGEWASGYIRIPTSLPKRLDVHM